MTTAQHDLTDLADPRGACVLAREGACGCRGGPLTAVPPARFLLNVEPLAATQSVLSMVSLSLFLRLSMQQQSVPRQTETEAPTQTAAAPASDLLTHVQPGLGRGGRVFPHLAGKAFGAVAALEDF